MVLCISGTYGQLLDYVIFAALVFYFLTTLALFRLRRTRPDLPRPVKAFGYPGAPRAIHGRGGDPPGGPADLSSRSYTWPGLVIVAAGIPVYLALAARYHSGRLDTRIRPCGNA